MLNDHGRRRYCPQKLDAVQLVDRSLDGGRHAEPLFNLLEQSDIEHAAIEKKLLRTTTPLGKAE
ncbi:hypothetical protein D3C80_2236070 [compost metagenome]